MRPARWRPHRLSDDLLDDRVTTVYHHVLGNQLRYTDLPGQRENRNQPRISDQIRIIERDIHRRGHVRDFIARVLPQAK